MKYTRHRDAVAEARRRTQLGRPHHVVEVVGHDSHCLVSDGLIIPTYPCTCRNAHRVGWSLQMGN